MSKYLISTIFAVAAVYAMSFVGRSLGAIDFASITLATLALSSGWVAIVRGQSERDALSQRVVVKIDELGETIEKASSQRAELLNQKMIEVETNFLECVSRHFEDTQTLLNQTSQHFDSELLGIGNSISEKHQEVKTGVGSVVQDLKLMGSSLRGVITEQGCLADEGLSLLSKGMNAKISSVLNELSVHKEINEDQSLKALDKVQQVANELRETLSQDVALKSELIRSDISNSSKVLEKKLTDVQSVIVESNSELKLNNVKMSGQIVQAVDSVKEAVSTNDKRVQKAFSDNNLLREENHVDLKGVILELFRQMNEKSELAFDDTQHAVAELCSHIGQLEEKTSSEIVSVGQQSQEKLIKLNDALNDICSEIANTSSQAAVNLHQVIERLAHGGKQQTEQIQGDISCLSELFNESLLNTKTALLNSHGELWKQVVQASEQACLAIESVKGAGTENNTQIKAEIFRLSEQSVECYEDVKNVVIDHFRRQNEDSVLAFEGIQQAAKDLCVHIDKLGDKSCLEISKNGQQSIEKIEQGNRALTRQNDLIGQKGENLLEAATKKINTIDALVQKSSNTIENQVKSLSDVIESNHAKIETEFTSSCENLNGKYSGLVEQLKEVASAQRTQLSFNGMSMTPEDLHQLGMAISVPPEDSQAADVWAFEDGNISRSYSPGKLLSIHDRSSDTRTLYSHDDQKKTVISDIEVGGKLRYRTLSSHLGAPVKGWEFDSQGNVKVEYRYDDNGQLQNKKIVNA
jgi:hypothetical protein